MKQIEKKIITVVLLITVFAANVFSQEENISKKLFKYFSKTLEQTRVDSIQSIYSELLRDFPEASFKNYSYVYNMVRSNLAIAMIKENDPAAEQMIAAVESGQIRRNNLGAIANQLLKVGKAERAEQLLKTELLVGKKDSVNYYTYSYYYADLLYQLGRYGEALQWIKPLKENGGLKYHTQLFLYAYVQAEMKNYNESIAILSDLTKKGMADEKVKMVLKKSWIGLGNKAENYDGYLKGLLAELNTETIAHLKKNEVNYQAPDFTLLDLNGKQINLSDLKNKVVVLDFWATWCGPCVGAFPAMQKTVNKYKNNKDVVFLFINSWEPQTDSVKRKALVKKFLAERPYKFNVLLDPNPGSKQDDYVVISKYKVSGIPAKFIIDKKGNIRYALKGFNGGDDATVQELSIAIDNLLRS